jgi:hypothetical protein
MPAHRFAFSIDEAMARAGQDARRRRRTAVPKAPRTLITAIHRGHSFE